MVVVRYIFVVIIKYILLANKQIVINKLLVIRPTYVTAMDSLVVTLTP